MIGVRDIFIFKGDNRNIIPVIGIFSGFYRIVDEVGFKIAVLIML
jgi:hypothetical protein